MSATAVPFLKLQSSHWPMSCNKQSLTKVRYECQGIKNLSTHNRAHRQDKTQHFCLYLLTDTLQVALAKGFAKLS